MNKQTFETELKSIALPDAVVQKVYNDICDFCYDDTIYHLKTEDFIKCESWEAFWEAFADYSFSEDYKIFDYDEIVKSLKKEYFEVDGYYFLKEAAKYFGEVVQY